MSPESSSLHFLTRLADATVRITDPSPASPQLSERRREDSKLVHSRSMRTRMSCGAGRAVRDGGP